MIFFFKIVLPVALMIGAVVMWMIGGEFNSSMSVMLGSVALVIWLFVKLAELAHSSTGDREAEAAARDEFTRTGRWPHDPQAD